MSFQERFKSRSENKRTQSSKTKFEYMNRTILSIAGSYILTALLFPLSTNAQVSQQLRLKSGIYDVETLERNERWPQLDTNEIIDGKYFRIVQFSEIPTQQVKESLKDAGVELQDYLPNRAYFAAIDRSWLH